MLTIAVAPEVMPVADIEVVVQVEDREVGIVVVTFNFDEISIVSQRLQPSHHLPADGVQIVLILPLLSVLLFT